MRKLALFFALGLCLAGVVLAFGQSSEPAQPSQGTSQAQDADKNHPHLGRQLAQESREAAGEDDTAQFKRSWSVQKIAQLTGLSMEQSYKLSVFINIFCLAVLMIGVLWKWGIPTLMPPPVPYMRERTVLIRKAMEEARQASADANRRLSEVEARLSRLGAEIAAMSAAGEKEASAEEERIKVAAEDDARRIVAAAEHEIDAAAKSARRDLTAFAADLAVALATKQIRVDETSDQALVGSFAAQLSGGDSRKEQL